MSKYRYTGKEICQGCGRPGTEAPRFAKNNLCDPCQDNIKAGAAINHEAMTPHVRVRDWVNGFASLDFDDRLVDTTACALFEALHNPTAHVVSQVSSPRAQPHGSTFYVIPQQVAQPLMDFMKAISDKVREIKGIKEEAEREARLAVGKERDRIFNEGVEKGRDLLFQLNRGEITVEEFSKKLKYQ